VSSTRRSVFIASLFLVTKILVCAMPAQAQSGGGDGGGGGERPGGGVPPGYETQWVAYVASPSSGWGVWINEDAEFTSVVQSRYYVSTDGGATWTDDTGYGNYWI